MENEIEELQAELKKSKEIIKQLKELIKFIEDKKGDSMKPSTKVFAILSLSAAIGKMMEQSRSEDRKQHEIDKINWRGKKLAESGTIAVMKYPLPVLTQSKLKQVGKKVDEICKDKEDFLIVEKLSFLIAALVDIRSKINESRRFLIDPVLKRAKWAMELFDPRYEQDDIHIKALNDYDAWSN